MSTSTWEQVGNTKFLVKTTNVSGIKFSELFFNGEIKTLYKGTYNECVKEANKRCQENVKKCYQTL